MQPVSTITTLFLHKDFRSKNIGIINIFILKMQKLKLRDSNNLLSISHKIEPRPISHFIFCCYNLNIIFLWLGIFILSIHCNLNNSPRKQKRSNKNKTKQNSPKMFRPQFRNLTQLYSSLAKY